MKYIMLFEGADDYMKELFKDVIDWNFFNYLMYKLTEFEDKGFIECFLIICAYTNKKGGKRYVYRKVSNRYGFFTTGSDIADSIYEDYKNNGLCYIFDIGDNTVSGIPDYKLVDDIYMSIRTGFSKYEDKYRIKMESDRLVFDLR